MTTTPLTPAEVRGELVKALRLDTVGPFAGDSYEKEELSQAPSRWYLTGFLVPYEAPLEDGGEAGLAAGVDQEVGGAQGEGCRDGMLRWCVA